MKIRHALSTTALVVAVAAVAAGCGSGGKSSTSSSSTSSSGSSSGGSIAKGPITIGMSIAKTGSFSVYDLGVESGVKYEVAKINAAGGLLGHQVVVKDFDTATKIDNSAPGAKQLLDGGAKFIIGTSDYDYGGPASRLASSQGVFTMGFAGDTKFGYHGIGPLAFNAFAGSPTTGATTAQFAYAKGWRKAYTLTDTINSYPATVTDYFTKEFSTLPGAKVVGKDLFLNSDNSVATQIARIKSANPDVLLLSSFPPGGASALKQIRAAGINIPVLGDVGFDGHYWYSAVPHLSNFYAPRLVSQFGNDPNPDVNSFFATLKKQTGKDALLGSYPAAGVTEVQVWAEGVKEAKSTDGKAVAAAVSKLTDFPSMLGTINYAWKPQCNVPKPQPIPYYQVTDGVDKPIGSTTLKTPIAFPC